MHIVEELIAERAPKLMARPRLFKVVRPALYRMLAYDAAVFLADSIRNLTGYQAFKRVADHISPRTAVKGLSHLPSSGRCIIIANHPTGLADGLAVFQAISDRRPEHCYLANADALRVIPKGHDIIIPVEWVKDKRSHAKARQTLVDMKKALEAQRCVVIFPSGRLAQMTWHGLEEKPWESSAAMIAKKYNAPIIPLNIKARNSSLYYLFSRLNPELRDITLFHELLNKKGKTFRLTFGEPIHPQSLPKNADIAIADIRQKVMNL
ncbi:putative hemolysin [Litorimonas taeanensis]|uniref:Putative hemolysin n=1 Tax=Litorimonas taeanensis TaxID=568099 RepID=A0A420WEI4_9PROT|nr:1-acyl-sn-glycerol-3-phosphate acyltransferase [Litorimonas taeanensis]RKQ69345.1 putative hemolysin [Litorimonas taeanensis]